MRLDAAVARVFGISRTVAAELVRSGDVSVDGTIRRKSDRVAGGAFVKVVLPDEPAPLQVVPVEVPDLGIVYEDDAIVVVDKPVGIAAHPSPGWDGPTVIGGWPPPATGSPRPAPPSGKASCTGWTSARRG